MAEQDMSVSYQFTKAGNNLSAKALAGTVKIDFTRAELSTTSHFGEAEADISGLTELDGVTQTVDLKEVDAVEDDPSFVKIPVQINETAVTEDYALLTIGLYCKPDDGDEVLYSICSLKDPIYIHKSSNNSTFTLNLNTLVGSAANVVIKVDPAGMVTNATFDAFKVTMGQQYALKSDLDAYLKEIPANVAYTDAANVFTEQQTLSAGAVNGEGKAYITGDDVKMPDGIVSLSDDGVTTTARDKTGAFYSTVNVTDGQDLNEVLYGLALTQGVGRINVNYGATNMKLSHSITGTYDANGARCFVNAHDNGSTTVVGDTWFISAYVEGDTKGVYWEQMVYKDSLPDMTQYTKTEDLNTQLNLDDKANTTDVVGIDPNTSQITNAAVKANAGQILIGGQPAISLVESADDATALTESSKDAILHFTIEG